MSLNLIEREITKASPVGRRFDQSGVLIHFFDYSDVESLALLHRERIMDGSYAAVVSLLRGGAYLGTMVSHYCGLKHESANYDRANDKVSSTLGPAPFPGARVLVTEDIAGRGVTLVRVLDHLHSLGWTADTFVIAHDDLSRIRPTYGQHIGQARPVFAWERGLISPQVLEDRSLSHAYQDSWLTAFDLDGVFLPDVPTAMYDSDLQAALALRDATPVADRFPQKWRIGAPIVTARPEMDRERTLAWLKKHGITTEKLVMRPSVSIPPEIYKVDALRHLGVTEFVESELPLAQAIARALPYCVVWHYDIDSGRMTRIRNEEPVSDTA